MAYIVIGLIALLVIIPLSMLLKKDPSQVGLLADGVAPDAGKIETQGKENNTQPTSFSLLQAFRTRIFWLLWFALLLLSLCFNLIVTHIVPHAIDIDILAMEAAVYLSPARRLITPFSGTT